MNVGFVITLTLTMADSAVFRPATGAWSIPIGADFADVPLMWGLPADIPILGRQ